LWYIYFLFKNNILNYIIYYFVFKKKCIKKINKLRKGKFNKLRCSEAIEILRKRRFHCLTYWYVESTLAISGEWKIRSSTNSLHTESNKIVPCRSTSFKVSRRKSPASSQTGWRIITRRAKSNAISIKFQWLRNTKSEEIPAIGPGYFDQEFRKQSRERKKRSSRDEGAKTITKRDHLYKCIISKVWWRKRIFSFFCLLITHRTYSNKIHICLYRCE